MLAAQIATSIMKIFGMPLIQEGSTIITPHTSLVVDDQCSGIRSLISLMALGSVYAYLSPLNLKKKIAMFLITIPIAIIANVARIMVMIIAAFIYGGGIINNKVFHEGTGLLVFIVAIVLLFGVQRMLSNGLAKQ
jgi:exosortase